MTQENRTTLKSGWATNITDGGANTAAEIRAELDDIADSCWNITSDVTTALSSAAHTVTSTSATALVVGPNGATNPSLTVDCSTASAANGLTITSSAAGSNVTLGINSSGSNEGMVITNKGTGNIAIRTASTGTVALQTGGANTRVSIAASTVSITPGAASSGATNRLSFTAPADTSLTASTNVPVVNFDMSSTRQHATGALTLQQDLLITGGTHSFVGSSTVTDAATVSISGPPIAGTNATITNAHGLYIPTRALTGTVGTANSLTVVAPSGATTNNAANFTGAVQISLSSTTVAATPSIDAAALLGQALITWTPSSDPASGTFVTGLMRKTLISTATSAVTGIDHPVAGYDYLEMTGNNNLDLAFVHEAKFKKTGSGTLQNLSFYKPAIDSVSNTLGTITLYDGDMDLGALSYTSAYLMNNANRSYLAFNTVGTITGATGNQVPTSVWPSIASNRYYFPRGWGSTSTTAITKDYAIATPPIIIPERTTFTTIGIHVTASVASSVARLGIYKMGADGIPTTLVLDAGTVTTDTTGERNKSISVTLEAGAYQLVYQSTGGASGATVSCLAFSSAYLAEIYGLSAGLASTAAEDWMYISNTGTLPTPFGTPSRLLVGAVPAVYLKK